MIVMRKHAHSNVETVVAGGSQVIETSAVAALLTDCTMEIERGGPPAGVGDKTTPSGVAS